MTNGLRQSCKGIFLIFFLVLPALADETWATEKPEIIERRAAVRQMCHQKSVFDVAKKHHINGDSYIEIAAKMPKTYVLDIIKGEEQCVLKEHSKHPELIPPSEHK